MASGDREVSGTEVSFEQAVEDGLIPSPPLLYVNGWQEWRAGPGKKPTKKKCDPVFTSSKQESTVWKAAMERYHGAGWRDALDEEEAEVAEQDRKKMKKKKRAHSG